MHEVQDEARDSQPSKCYVEEWPAGDTRDLLDLRDEGVPNRERLGVSKRHTALRNRPPPHLRPNPIDGQIVGE